MITIPPPLLALWPDTGSVLDTADEQDGAAAIQESCLGTEGIGGPPGSAAGGALPAGLSAQKWGQEWSLTSTDS